MGGWRDVDGRTASQRHKARREADRAAFVDDARRRPLHLLKGIAGFTAVVVLALALVAGLR